MKCKRDLSKKEMIKIMNIKMTTKSQLSITEPKKHKNKNKVSKQLQQEENHRNGDHMEGYQLRANGSEGTGNKKHKW